MNKPVSFIAYHGSVEDNLELAPNKAFYLCASYILAKEFAYREVYGDGLYVDDVPMIYKFKGTFKNPYYLTEEEYDSEGQDSNIDFQKWVDMGVDGIVFQNRQTYYIVIDPSTIRLIGKKYLPFDEEYLKRTDDQNNDKDDIIGENVEYHKDIEILINPTSNEFKHFMKPKGWYRMCLTNDTAIVWDANTSILHQDIDKEYNLKNSEHIFIHKGKPYLQDYDLDEYSFANKEAFLNVAKNIDNNPIFKRYFPNHSMEIDIHKAIDNNGKYIAEEMVHTSKKDLSDVILKNPTRKELKEYSNITDWRIIQDTNGNYYFADAMVYLHSWMVKALLSKNIDVVNADEDNYGIIHYTVAYNAFFYRLLDLIDREDVIKEYNNSYLSKAFPNAQFIRNHDDRDENLNESNEQYISESIFDYGIPMIFPDPTYSEFHKIMRDNTTYGKLSAIIDRGHIYCWDSGMAHHHQMIKHIENQLGERLSDNAMWVRFKEPNLAWVSAEYFNDYDDDELDNLETQDFEKELENNPIIKKYFPQGIKLVRFDRIVESRKMDKKMINESICFNDMAYNEAFNKFEDLTVWKNPSIEWIKNQLKNIDLRFIYNPDADILYVWDGGKWMHSEVMDTVDMKMSSNVNIIGVFSPGAVEIWAEISPADDADEAKMLTRKYAGKLLKQIYPYGYQLIAYT